MVRALVRAALVMTALVAGAITDAARGNESAPSALSWSQLPSLPDGEGFAGPFAGVSGGALLVAGGANFPEDRWKNPPRKVWHAGVFVLERAGASWISGHRLPNALAYGVSIGTPKGVLCVGGSDADRHYRDVFELRWKNGTLETIALPPLPRPCANACGALVGNTVYVAGGTDTPESDTALRQFLSFNLDAAQEGWRELEPWPGPGRMLAIAASHEGAFFLFSGASLHPEPGGKPARKYLQDAYRYTPGAGWKELARLPRAAAAAPSPLPVFRGTHLLVLGGDDGSTVGFTPIEDHPGFSKEILAYEPTADRWTKVGTLPFARVTVPAVLWDGQTIIPSGEVRPRVRTPEVWALLLGEKP